MGICQSVACTISVVDATGYREVYNVSLKELKTLQTMGDMLRYVNIGVHEKDTMFTQDHKPIRVDAPFQIQSVVVYRGLKTFQYRITMNRLY
jgi:hypothetical protein